MKITHKCKDCDAEHTMDEASKMHYRGLHYRPSTKERVWLCVECRPDDPDKRYEKPANFIQED